ncbi:hypothetical protein QZH41_006502 [Actinostola sp. cb2023]|nr:hypothetical protein QZH41_006502 [Actinostola sp. cb2023]
MHRTQTEYEDNLTFKVFVFQFVNFYSSIFYIAFFKGKISWSLQTPLWPSSRRETIISINSMVIIIISTIISINIMVISTIISINSMVIITISTIISINSMVISTIISINIMAISTIISINSMVMIIISTIISINIMAISTIIINSDLIMIKAYMKRRKRGTTKGEIKPRWEQDYELVENEGLFQEYLEMVLQFGFITIFVAAFPLAPFFALANNVFEIRIDSDKFVCEVRRTIADRAQDLGIWFDILDTVAKIAVISNHFVFFVMRLIDMMVPDIPTDLEITIKREAYLAKQALADHHSLGANDFRLSYTYNKAWERSILIACSSFSTIPSGDYFILELTLKPLKKVSNSR